MRCFARCLPALALLCLLPGLASAQPSSYLLFESGPVRPLTLSPSGGRLYAANVPDGRLEIFNVVGGGELRRVGSVAVGMEPVTVVARSEDEVWVVNHLSDSISIVDVSASPPRVMRTLLVGDEPRGLVFANGLAFVTTAHRGQQRTNPTIDSARNAGSDDGDPNLTTAGEPRADVWVFDTTDLDQGAPNPVLGGVPVEIVELFGDTPRALAVNGNTVYAAVFHSGNRTTTVSEGMVCNGFGASQCSGDGVVSPGGLAGGNLPGGNPGPSDNAAHVTAPETGLIVQYNAGAGQWQDELGRNWSNGVRFGLPDLDVFAIDATTCGDVNGCDVTQSWSGVGTILFNMVANPSTGVVYVSNTDSKNLTRFEGPGTYGGSTVQGNLSQAQLTVLAPGGVSKPRHLNGHIDYSILPAPAGTKQHSLATPLDMVLSGDGSTLYVAAFGSDKVGVFSTADLENDALWDGLGGDDFDPTTASAGYFTVTGGGPAGLALKEGVKRLYVLTRFSNAIAIVNTQTGNQVGSVPLYSPEPAHVREGRFMLYDAQRTSSNGEASCSSCHIFGDMDDLAWDLGDPDASVSTNPIPINLLAAAGDQNGGASNTQFHPMKGPMTTQTLRGLINSGAMHWRGDRADGFFGIDSPYSADTPLSFDNFIVAFPGLVGLDTPPTDPTLQADMHKFTDFALELTLPPNPVRALDNSLSTSQQAGRTFYLGNGPNDCADGLCLFGQEGNLGFSCQGCHTLDAAQGHFGTGGISSFENETQIVKIAHLRNLYQKVGMFGMPNVGFFNGGDNGFKGDQVRGFGFLHDGSTDTVFRFLQATVFNDQGLNAGFNGGDPQRRDVEQFLLAFDTDLAPIVGQQVTLRSDNGAEVGGRINLLIQRASANFTSQILGGVTKECDLVVKGTVGGIARGFLYDPNTALFEDDMGGTLSDAALRALATGSDAFTYTCVPPGSGVRVGIDRDEDGFRDGEELVAGTDPANPGSLPGACSNGLDDDGDGAIDILDVGCKNAGSTIENPECSDGVDNDGDGGIDLADVNCDGGPSDNRELRTNQKCGIGFELVFLLPLLGRLRRARGPRAAA